MKQKPTALEIARAAYDAAALAWRTAKTEKEAERKWAALCDASNAIRHAQNEFAKQKTTEENA